MLLSLSLESVSICCLCTNLRHILEGGIYFGEEKVLRAMSLVRLVNPAGTLIEEEGIRECLVPAGYGVSGTNSACSVGTVHW